MMKKFWLLIYVWPLLFCSNIFAALAVETNISGISNDLLSNAAAALKNKEKSYSEFTQATATEFYQTAPREITKALQPYGYFKPQISAKLKTTNKRWVMNFQVKPGPALKISAIDLKIYGAGSSDKQLMRALASFPLKTGAIFQTESYTSAKSFLFSAAANYGYLQALLTEKTVYIDLEKYTARVVLEFNTGAKYYFGNVTFTPGPFSEKFLQRFLPFQYGEIYTGKKVQELQDALTNSNYFRQVAIIPRVAKAEKLLVPIDVELEPRKAKQFNLGAGYGTDTGVRASLGMELRHLTTMGQSLKSMLQLSQIQNDLEMHYLIPGRRPATDQYDLSLAGETLNLDYGKSFTAQVAAGYITVFHGWHQTIKLSLQHELDQYSNGKPDAHATLLMPSVNWLHSETDDPARPNFGHNISLNVQGASKSFLAPTNFFQAQALAKYIYTWRDDWQIFLRGSLGYTAIDRLSDLPLSLQFFTGGAQSVRGYDYNSIGPGKSTVTASVELRRRVIGDIFLNAFFDCGSANDRFFGNLNKGAGVGVVWRTMIGTLELSIARSININGMPYKVQFSMGPEL
ncbi:MAG: autotransporter assembly complex protein TamA [Gammaproteobacteria bacterium]|nr:autotransporter assembly complex protein TamA [Gammaproteobacteria bacterium]